MTLLSKIVLPMSNHPYFVKHNNQKSHKLVTFVQSRSQDVSGVPTRSVTTAKNVGSFRSTKSSKISVIRVSSCLSRLWKYIVSKLYDIVRRKKQIPFISLFCPKPGLKYPQMTRKCKNRISNPYQLILCFSR